MTHQIRTRSPSPLIDSDIHRTIDFIKNSAAIIRESSNRIRETVRTYIEVVAIDELGQAILKCTMAAPDTTREFRLIAIDMIERELIRDSASAIEQMTRCRKKFLRS